MITISGTKEEIYDFVDDYVKCPFPYECPSYEGLNCTECTIKYNSKFKFVIE